MGYLYEGPIFKLRQDTITLPNGKEAVRDIIEHNGATAIIAVADDGRLVLVRQFRYGAGCDMLEIPAGKLDPGEDPEECALRELAEETGYRAARIRKVMDLCMIPAWSTERVGLYLAEGLVKGETQLDDEEFVEVELYSVKELLGMIDSGEISDSKTVLAVFYYAGRLGLFDNSPTG